MTRRQLAWRRRVKHGAQIIWTALRAAAFVMGVMAVLTVLSIENPTVVIREALKQATAWGGGAACSLLVAEIIERLVKR